MGTWIDGKPLYQKTIEFSEAVSGNGEQKNIKISALTNVKHIVSQFGYVQENNGGLWEYAIPIQDLAITGQNRRCHVWKNISYTSFDIRAIYLSLATISASTMTGVITVQYTKTTD